MKVALILLAFTLTSARAVQRNILLIIADDYGIDSNSLYNASPGAALPPTPNINALKTSGVLFRNAYAQPTCSPARACLLSGRHPFRHGVTTAVTANDGQLRASEFTLPRAFAANAPLGYAVASFGKWHLTISSTFANDPAAIAGWPHYAGSLNGAVNSYTAWTKTVNGVTGTTNGTTAYATTDVTDDTIAWIAARGTQPWFAWVGYNAPHTPFHKPPNNLHTYDTTVAGWATLSIPANQRTHYNAAVQAMDTEIGRLLSSMSPAVRANTDIIFLGDNGTPNQVIQAPFSTGHAKDSLYEGGMHVPMIISGPDVVSPNRDSIDMVNAVDIYATVLELAGISVAGTQPATNPIDAVSLLPILKNQAATTRYGYVEQSGSTLTTAESGKAVINAGGYKLIVFQDGHEEFYLLSSDPNETANLLNGTLSPAAQANYTELKARIATYVAPANPLGTPLEKSWLTYPGTGYARIYKTQANATATNKISSTTWPVPFNSPGSPHPVINGGQATPAYAGVQSLRVSANWLYMQSSGLPYHVIGPWYFDAAKTDLFLSWPSKMNVLVRFPRVPVPAITKSPTTLGAIAYWVDGTIIHNQLDAFYWNGTADVTNMGVTGSWERNAALAEGPTFDPDAAHQPFTGEHHHHISPSGLRYLLGDHISYNSASHTYTENPAMGGHSPIIGWAFDGYPIYGPYGFANPNDAGSAVRRMVSGYVPRNGAFGTTNLSATGRTSYPAWALAMPTQLTNLNGPAVSPSYPLGWYVQDFDHLGDRGYVQGAGQFDLDRYNGRWCVTPQFPGGTYAYFVTIEANGTPAFPYVIGRQYYGVKQGGNYGAAATIGFTAVETPSVTVYEGGGKAAPEFTNFSQTNASGGQVTLSWSSVEGGRYTVNSSADLTQWSSVPSNLPGGPYTTTQSLNAPDAKRFYRVRFDSVDPYDQVTTP